MKAIVFAAPIPTYLLTLAAGALSKRLLVGPHACTRYAEVEDPALPGEDWVRVRTRTQSAPGGAGSGTSWYRVQAWGPTSRRGEIRPAASVSR